MEWVCSTNNFGLSIYINSRYWLTFYMIQLKQEDDIDYPLQLTWCHQWRRWWFVCSPFTVCLNLFQICLQCYIMIVGEVCEQSVIQCWLHPEVGWERFETGDSTFGYGKQEYDWYYPHVWTHKNIYECMWTLSLYFVRTNAIWQSWEPKLPPLSCTLHMGKLTQFLLIHMLSNVLSLWNGFQTFVNNRKPFKWHWNNGYLFISGHMLTWF